MKIHNSNGRISTNENEREEKGHFLFLVYERRKIIRWDKNWHLGKPHTDLDTNIRRLSPERFAIQFWKFLQRQIMSCKLFSSDELLLKR